MEFRIDEDNVEVIVETVVNGQTCWKLVRTPRPITNTDELPVEWEEDMPVVKFPEYADFGG